MLEGWRNQQLARNLAFATINGREAEVRRFMTSVGEFPWRWTAQMVDDWLGDQRAVRHLRQSTVRAKAITVKLTRELGLAEEVTFHSLRRFDARFVQEQVGHEHASTTSIYTCVSSDYRTRTLKDALARSVSPLGLNTGGDERL